MLIRKKYSTSLLYITLICLNIFTTNIKINSDNYLIVTIKPNYYLGANISHKIEVYTDEELDYGDVIKVDQNNLKTPSKSLSTYGYNSDKYYLENNIRYQTSSYKHLKHIPNLSSFVYSRIKRIDEPTTVSILNKLIFNIADYELLNDYILESGLNYYGFSLILLMIFKYFFKEEKANELLNYCLLLIFIINPCFQAIRFLIYRFCSLNIKERYKSFGIMTIVVMFLFPYKATSISFLFPTILRLFALVKDKNTSFLTLIIFLNGYFFNEVSILKVLAFQIFSSINGLFMLLAIILIPVKCLVIKLSSCYLLLTNLISKMDITIRGHTGIITLILYFLIYKSLKDFKHKDLIIMSILIFFNINNIYGSVSFINVGHGDAALIKSPFNKETILIDTGSVNNYYRLNNYLKGKGVNKIDYLLLTHNDEDHSGNVDNLLNDFKVSKIITSKEDLKTPYLNLLQLNTKEYSLANTNSNCYYTRINKLAYLFTGDIDIEAESAILREFNNLDIDILKVAHHGSKTSSSKEFIKQISPIISIISCSNKYNFPSSITLETLNNNKSLVLLTKEVGDIEIINILGFNFLKTSNHKYFFIH